MAPGNATLDPGRMKIEIHHKHEIASGGAVYDLDNLLLMTPRVHIDHHKENNQ